MKDPLELAIEAAVRAGATPNQLAEMLRGIVAQSTAPRRNPDREESSPERLKWFQERVAEVVALAPASIRARCRGGEIELTRQIQHSIATETITLSYRVPGTPLMVREVIDASETAEMTKPAVAALKQAAESMLERAMSTERRPPTPQAPFEMDDTCPHAEV